MRRTVTVCATLSTVSILDGASVIASHPRSFDKGQQIEDENHIADLVMQKTGATARGQDQLREASTVRQTLLIQAANRYDVAHRRTIIATADTLRCKRA